MVNLNLPDWLAREEPQLARKRYPDPTLRMRLAIALAERNVSEATGGPFGAAVFSEPDGRLLAVGVNVVRTAHCSLAHAEMLALALAQQRTGCHRLSEAGLQACLATSAQPCSMCFGALFWAGLDSLLIGARKGDVEQAAGFDEGPLPRDWKHQLGKRGLRVICDLLRDEARGVLQRYRASGGGGY